MKTRIAINGFGRIGRCVFKVAFERPDLEIVAINDLSDIKTLAHLLRHDTAYGAYHHDVKTDNLGIIVDGHHIKVMSQKNPAELPWGAHGVDIVVEATGSFRKQEQLKAHLHAGARRVMLSAPQQDEENNTVIIGVNEHDLKPEHTIVSTASCTTNCIAPVSSVIESNFGIQKAMMNTVHSYTASQRLQDAPAKDWRKARAAAENIVPTTTGASIAAAQAMPSLKGIFGGLSVRVPTLVVSLADIVFITESNVTVEAVNAAFKKAAKEPYYQGIMDVTEEELVSSDFKGNSHSAIVDLPLTMVVDNNMLRVVAWYDNEWGYSNRLVELVADMGKQLQG